jgi:hypothetical protein
MDSDEMIIATGNKIKTTRIVGRINCQLNTGGIRHMITKKDIPPTYCKGCSFKCQASDCECTCHDKIREYWNKKEND